MVHAPVLGSYPLVTNVRIALHDFYFRWDVPDVQGMNKPQQCTLIVTLCTHISEEQKPRRMIELVQLDVIQRWHRICLEGQLHHLSQLVFVARQVSEVVARSLEMRGVRHEG